MSSISVVIPHRGRTGLLDWHLKELMANQSFVDFEVIVVGDYREEEKGESEKVRKVVESHGALYERNPGIGPGPARNHGAELSSGDVVLILGSDCIPHRDLVARHYEGHLYGNDIVQGYTPFHGDVITPFYDFLETSGLQAAWANLKNENGEWRTDITPLFCLTTNYSISRRMLLNEPFDPRLDQAAWDDVELGYRLSRYEGALKAIFYPGAVNYHYHKYDIDSFLLRCRMEGANRLKLCKIHPEMAWNMLNPFALREVKNLEVSDVKSWAHEMDEVRLVGDNDQVKKLKEIKYERYAEACRIHSYVGVLDQIKNEHPAMQALPNVHTPAQLIQIVTGVDALNTGHYAYASHTAEWFMTDRPDDWSAHAFAGEVELEIGNTEEAIMAFRRSLDINGAEEWPKNRLKELLGVKNGSK